MTLEVSGVRRALVGTAALVAGAIIAFSLPPFGIWVLGPIGLAVAAALIEAAPTARRAGIGALVGIGQFTIGCAFALEFTALGYVSLVAFESLLVAVALVVVPPGRPLIVGFVAAITLVEWVRDTWPFGGMPLGGIALGQADGPLAGLARVGGPLLVVAATACAGSGLGLVASGVVAPAVPCRRRMSRVLLGSVALAAVASAAGLAALAPSGATTGAISVAIVQGGGRRGVTSLEVPPTRSFDATLAVVERIRAPVDLVVCPEDALALGAPLARSNKAARFASRAKSLDTTILAGVTFPVGRARFVNEIVAFGPTGKIIGRVEKVHPVPFGEYVPLRALVSKVASLNAVPRDVIVGHNDGALSTPAGRVAILNSFEAFYPGRGRAAVRAGAALLVLETNTASYATSQAPAMELAASRLQSIAEGRTLVQSATTGYSAIATPGGKVTVSSELGRAQLIRATVALRSGWTLYDRFGDAWVLALGAVALGGAWAAEIAARRKPAERLFRARRR